MITPFSSFLFDLAATGASGASDASSVGLLGYLVALGVGGLLVEALRSYVLRKTRGADYASVISESAVRLLDPLERRIKELEEEVVELKKTAHDASEELKRERMLRRAAEHALLEARAQEATSERSRRITAEGDLRTLRADNDASNKQDRDDLRSKD